MSTPALGSLAVRAKADLCNGAPTLELWVDGELLLSTPVGSTSWATLGRLRERLRASFWPLPALCCVIALALGLLLTRSDQQIADNVPFLFPGGPDGARRDDWRQAEQILGEEAERASSPSTGARQAMAKMRRRQPVSRAEVEPRVFVRATDNWVELSACFVVPVRAARSVKDEVTRRVLERFAEHGLTVPSATQEIGVHAVEDGPGSR